MSSPLTYFSCNLERPNIYRYICWKLLHKCMFCLCDPRALPPFLFQMQKLHSLLNIQICDQCYVLQLCSPVVWSRISSYPGILCLNSLEPGYMVARFMQACVMCFCLAWLGLIWDLCTSMSLTFLLCIKISLSISLYLWFCFIWAISPHCFPG